jgi:glutamine---fructose-6-phosphate transaminase (isomerizing)
MCGIFGFVASPESSFKLDLLPELLENLFVLSESRGKDASGIAVLTSDNITIYKRPMRARNLIRQREFKQLTRAIINGNESSQLAIVGHARMVTNGHQEHHFNNQPVTKHGMVCLHNGIIVNDQPLWNDIPNIEREYEVDTEVLLSLIEYNTRKGLAYNDAIHNALNEIQGANSIALVSDKQDTVVLATSNGSLYYAQSTNGKELIFASEKYIAQQIMADPSVKDFFGDIEPCHLMPKHGVIFEINHLEHQTFELSNNQIPELEKQTQHIRKIDDIYVDIPSASNGRNPTIYSQTYKENDVFLNRVTDAVSHLRRCTRCLLPETFPFISYDDDGVCNICRNYQPINFLGEDKLHELVNPHRKTNGAPDVLVPLSGGRDSSYSIHYIKNELNLNPVAYTYDWGMVTDLARRNISRMCGALEIEHILISADINTKRENIRKNVAAWLKRPRLGTVPLFMAGDKQFFYYANMLRNQMNIDMVLFGMNPLERTDFKVGFTGVNEIDTKQEKHYALSLTNQAKMAMYYGTEFLMNPRYLNSSMLDSMFAFVSYYMIPKNYDILYEYLPWDENEINDTLLGTYDWETATDTVSTWRIGDGTASFYNYIYYVLAGFSENDTFRSNQIRENQISREEGMRLIERDNQPRYQSIQTYCETIGIDFSEAICNINNAPKLYEL